MSLNLSLLLLCFHSFLVTPNFESNILTETTVKYHSLDNNIIPDPLKIIVDNNASSIKLISNSDIQLESITIYNLLGKVVLKRRRIVVRKKRGVSTKNINNGIYIIEVVLENREVITKKVIISN